MNDLLLIVLALVAAGLAAALFVLIRNRPAMAPAPVPDESLGTLGAINQQLTDLGTAVRDLSAKTAQVEGGLKSEFNALVSKFDAVKNAGDELKVATLQISTALQGTGVAGDWGELQLRRTVELAGLTEHVSFVEQEHVMTEEERRKRPDVIVTLPEGRQVVIDAKAPKIDFAGTEGAAAKQAEALKKHIDDLSKRDYSAYVSNTPDFVVLFVPTEGILATALSEKPELSEDAIKKKVLLATPMTLLAFLRSIEWGWKQLKQAENAKEIVEEAVKLYERITTFADHFASIRSGLKSAVDAFNKAVGSYQSRVLPQGDRMTELGAAVAKGKELPDMDIAPDEIRELPEG
jgi:DNA recombination protein RmuC